jgi:hypothetical protein
MVVAPGVVGWSLFGIVGGTKMVFDGCGVFGADAFRHALTTSAADFISGSIEIPCRARSARRSG